MFAYWLYKINNSLFFGLLNAQACSSIQQSCCLKRGWSEWYKLVGFMFFLVCSHAWKLQKKLSVHFHTKQHDEQQEKLSTSLMKFCLPNSLPASKKKQWYPYFILSWSLALPGRKVSVHIFSKWLKQDLELLPLMSPRDAIRILKLDAVCQVVLENTDQILTPISASKLGHVC